MPAKSNGTTATKPKPNRATSRTTVPTEGGYTRAKIIRLVFDDPDMAGLVVRAKRPSIGELFDIATLAENTSVDVSSMSAEEMEAVRELLKMFEPFLVWWNLEDDVYDDQGEPTGEKVPVPATVDGMLGQDLAFVLAVFQTWLGLVGDVPGPLDQPSSGGGLSAVPSIPLPVEPLASPGS